MHSASIHSFTPSALFLREVHSGHNTYRDRTWNWNCNRNLGMAKAHRKLLNCPALSSQRRQTKDERFWKWKKKDPRQKLLKTIESKHYGISERSLEGSLSNLINGGLEYMSPTKQRKRFQEYFIFLMSTCSVLWLWCYIVNHHVMKTMSPNDTNKLNWA